MRKFDARLALTLLSIVTAVLFAAPSSARADSNLHVFEGTLMYCSDCTEDGTCDGYLFAYAPNGEYNTVEAKMFGPAATQCLTWAGEWHLVRFTFWVTREWDGTAYRTVVRGDHLQDMGPVTSP